MWTHSQHEMFHKALCFLFSPQAALFPLGTMTIDGHLGVPLPSPSIRPSTKEVVVFIYFFFFILSFNRLKPQRVSVARGTPKWASTGTVPRGPSPSRGENRTQNQPGTRAKNKTTGHHRKPAHPHPAGPEAQVALKKHPKDCGTGVDTLAFFVYHGRVDQPGANQCQAFANSPSAQP